MVYARTTCSAASSLKLAARDRLLATGERDFGFLKSKGRIALNRTDDKVQDDMHSFLNQL